jgi:hypothetical protein
MTLIFLIDIGDWIAKINNPYSMAAAIFLGALSAMKFILPKLMSEKTQVQFLNVMDRYFLFGFWLGIVGLVVSIPLAFLDKVNMNSKYEHELAMIDNVSGEYNGVINSKSYFVTIHLDSIGKERPVDKVNIYDFDYKIKPSDLIEPEEGRGKVVAQRTNFWEGKEFTIDFSSSKNLPNMIGVLTPQEVGDIHYYRIVFNRSENFLLKKLK